jgi:hypothetical protein
VNPRVLAARAALASATLAFNPHQRRGPDGRWLKMPDSELKRPRRPARPKAAKKTAAEPDPLYRKLRDEYNELIRGEVHLRREMFNNPGEFDDPEDYADSDLYDALDVVEALPPGPELDAAVDVLAELFRAELGQFSELPPPPSRSPLPYAPRKKTTAVRPPVDAPYERRRAALQRSLDGGASGETPLSQGAMGETRKFELADGTSAIWKKAVRDLMGIGSRTPWSTKDSTDAEELSALTAAAIGVPAPAIQRTGDDTIFMETMPGEPAAIKYEDRRQPPMDLLRSRQGLKLGVLDVLIENTDRHGGNYLVDNQDNMYAIDHGMAFNQTNMVDESGRTVRRPTWTTSRILSPFALGTLIGGGQFITNPLTRSDVAHLRRKVDELKPQFEARGRADWWESMSERMDQLAAKATGTEDIYDPYLD